MNIEHTFISDPLSEILPTQVNYPSNLNLSSLPDVYDQKDVFANDTPEYADIWMKMNLRP